ncbi:MAG: hypothetical protein QXM43_00670 [Desulfurococcaceae archaeon]
MSLQLLNLDLEVVDRVTVFKGSKGFILLAGDDEFLLSIDDKLVLVKGGASKIVLKASNPTNVFWHAVRADDKVFVHEYGSPPTGIYVSEDLERWSRLINNTNIDKRSQHFHCIAHDPYRGWLIATLGDACLTRVAVSEDLRSWRPLYEGPWQFVPIEVLEDRIVFGMDSGIARGGIGVYNPENDRWDFTFLKWHDGEVRFAQMCDLKRLDNGIWIATLGTPQAVIVSRDLKTWYAAYVEGFDKRFNYNMSIAEGKNFVACSTGNNLLIFEKGELAELGRGAQQVLVAYKAHIDRLKGFGFVLKSYSLNFPLPDWWI